MYLNTLLGKVQWLVNLKIKFMVVLNKVVQTLISLADKMTYDFNKNL